MPAVHETRPILVPILLTQDRDQDFDRQLLSVTSLLADVAEFSTPVRLGDDLPEADAAILPQIVGNIYRHPESLRALHLPLLIITSEFGTMSMFDWEAKAYLRTEGLNVLAPYTLAQARTICRTLGVQRELRDSKFLVYQDTPGEGQQPAVFKRFYWWEDACNEQIMTKFGISVKKKSLRALGEQMREIPDHEAEAVSEAMPVPTAGVSRKALNSALKLYIAVKRDLEDDPSIRAMGMNCLNESHFTDTTPCLAWSMLYEERGLIWGCEGDTMSMLTKYILHRSLGAPIVMSNMYPFPMGQVALKHERIDNFPAMTEPENCLLAAHCGYLGVVPRSFTTEWTLRPKVLGIVDDNATAIDGRLAIGEVTLAKLYPGLGKLAVSEGYLEGYVGYENSDCRNGAVIRVPDGHSFIDKMPSHHCLIMVGHHRAEIESLAKIFDLQIDQI